MKKLTAYNSQNDREISMMMGKAMCACANLHDVRRNRKELEEAFGKQQVAMRIECLKSEHEATVRCIAMFVMESVPEICIAVLESCNEEFGI